MNGKAVEQSLTPEQISRRHTIGRTIMSLAAAGLVGVIGVNWWYDENVRQYPERTEELSRVLDDLRKNRLAQYMTKVTDDFSEDKHGRLYVPSSIDGIAISLNELAGLNRLVQKRAVSRDEVLEGRLGLHNWIGGNEVTYDGPRLLTTEKGLIRQIIKEAVADAKSLGASTITPKINFTTTLTPNVQTGFPNYWDSKTRISGEIIYYR